MANKQESGLSEDAKTIITILLLIFVFPIGIIMMWIWMKWPVWVKILVTLVVALPFLIVIGAVSALGLLVAFNPAEKVKEARDVVRMNDLVILQNAINNVSSQNKTGTLLCNGKLGLCAGDSADKDINVKKTDGTGWIKVKLPTLTSLPVDPTNDTTSTHSYTYCSNGEEWEIQVGVESRKALEKAENDGGDDSDQYEVGTNLKLCQEFIDKTQNNNR